MSDDTQKTTIVGAYEQAIYDPETDDLAVIVAAHPMLALLSAIQVTPRQIVLRFGHPPLPIAPLYAAPPPVFPTWGPNT